MSKILKTLILAISSFAQLCVIGQSFAQSAAVIPGLSYLQSTQNPDGYWGDAAEVGYNTIIDTATAADTLRTLGETGSSYTLAIQWLNSAARRNIGDVDTWRTNYLTSPVYSATIPTCHDKPDYMCLW